jgi:hypothetical protein
MIVAKEEEKAPTSPSGCVCARHKNGVVNCMFNLFEQGAPNHAAYLLCEPFPYHKTDPGEASCDKRPLTKTECMGAIRMEYGNLNMDGVWQSGSSWKSAPQGCVCRNLFTGGNMECLWEPVAKGNGHHTQVHLLCPFPYGVTDVGGVCAIGPLRLEECKAATSLEQNTFGGEFDVSHRPSGCICAGSVCYFNHARVGTHSGDVYSLCTLFHYETDFDDTWEETISIDPEVEKTCTDDDKDVEYDFEDFVEAIAGALPVGKLLEVLPICPCGPGTYCLINVCVPKHDNGVPCLEDDQCRSNNCGSPWWWFCLS